jgi:outer membrane lipoprotein-sorting protein
MNNFYHYFYLWLIAAGLMLIPLETVAAQNAQQLVEKSFDYVRGKASISTVKMLIHRPGWQREMTIKAWTRGQKDSLFYIDAPPKDHGNGTLKKGRQMWMFNPKVNRVIKVPPSMMAQSWMGSDFSNNDLAKSDSLLSDYTHTIIDTETHDGLKVYVIESTPKPDAPVIWGMQRLKVRLDLIWLSQEFFDEDLKPVKIMKTIEIQTLGDRLFPKVWQMQKNDESDQFTRLTYQKLVFKENLTDSIFTLSNLRKPQR